MCNNYHKYWPFCKTEQTREKYYEKGWGNEVVCTCTAWKRRRAVSASRGGALIRASSESEVEIEFSRTTHTDGLFHRRGEALHRRHRLGHDGGAAERPFRPLWRGCARRRHAWQSHLSAPRLRLRRLLRSLRYTLCPPANSQHRRSHRNYLSPVIMFA